MSVYQVLWTETAQHDLSEIIAYIAQDSKTAAKKQYNGIKTSAADLVRFPEKGRIVPELKKQNIEKYRELIIAPWRVFYRIEQMTVFVLAVIDGRRNIEDILMSRILR